MTAACLRELSRAALVEALRERRTYATTGARILVEFSVAGVPMGGVGRTEESPAVRVVAHACAPIARIDVVRDGIVAYAAEDAGLDARLDWGDTDASPGEHWYLAKVVQQDGETAWTSPVWITVG